MVIQIDPPLILVRDFAGTHVAVDVPVPVFLAMVTEVPGFPGPGLVQAVFGGGTLEVVEYGSLVPGRRAENSLARRSPTVDAFLPFGLQFAALWFKAVLGGKGLGVRFAISAAGNAPAGVAGAGPVGTILVVFGAICAED